MIATTIQTSSLQSHDDSILLPHEIHLHDDGSATASHPEGDGDVEYDSLEALCEAYGLDEDEVRALATVREYVWATDTSTWSSTETVTEEQHERLCEAAESWLTDHEGDLLSIEVRPVRRGEADGLYERRANGDLQILGFSLPKPQDVDDLLSRAWEHACKTADLDEHDETEMVAVDDVRSAAIRAEARKAGLSEVEHLGTWGEGDKRIDLYELAGVRVIATNGDPIWEESDPSAFADVLAEAKGETDDDEDETTYTVTYHEPTDCDEATHASVLALDGSAKLDEAREHCRELGIAADLYDEAGSLRGRIDAHGDYRLG